MYSMMGVLLVLLFTSHSLCAPLLLSPYLAKGEYAKARELARIKSTQDLGYSGFLTVPSASGQHQNNLFFWFQQSSSSPSTPLSIWLQGGPGGPSTFGCISEIGRFYPSQSGELHERCYSWGKLSNIVYIDQPVQTGASYQTGGKPIEYTKTSREAMAQVWALLEQFFQIWPEYRSSPFFILGESYSGLYCAHLARVIVERQARLAINLKGVIVGDPTLNPTAQWPTYADTLYGMGVLMLDEKAELKSIMDKAVTKLGSSPCTEAFNEWNSVFNDNGGGGNSLFSRFTGSSNTENVLLGNDGPGSFDRGIQWIIDSAKLLHCDGSPAFGPPDPNVYLSFVHSGDFCSNASSIYSWLLTSTDVSVTIYSGTVDPLLGPPCSEAGIVEIVREAQMEKQWFQAPKILWKANETILGYARSSGKLSYVVIRGAGHEVPAYQPHAAFDMIRRCFFSLPFNASGDDGALTCDNQCGGSEPFFGSASTQCCSVFGNCT